MTKPGPVTFRPLTAPDLELVEVWLRRPHFARWFLPDSSVEAELASNRDSMTDAEPTFALIARLGERDVGWAQYYRWWDYPEHAAAYSAEADDIGIDYGIGEPDLIGIGVGTVLVGALVAVARAHFPGAPVLVGPSAANAGSCRVLEKNGFALLDVRDVPAEPNASPIALYRLPSPD